MVKVHESNQIFFKRISSHIKVNDPYNGSWWESNDDRSKAYEYNQKWEEWIGENTNATTEQVLDFGKKLSQEYGFKVNTYNTYANEYVYVGTGGNFDQTSNTSETTYDVYLPEVLSFSDYYPFHMQMPGRFDNSAGYRYGGSNGQEKETEITGNSSHFSAEYWMYDARLGRRWNVDPVVKPWESGYACFSNLPLKLIDIKGDNAKDPISPSDDKSGSDKLSLNSTEVINFSRQLLIFQDVIIERKEAMQNWKSSILELEDELKSLKLSHETSVSAEKAGGAYSWLNPFSYPSKILNEINSAAITYFEENIAAEKIRFNKEVESINYFVDFFNAQLDKLEDALIKADALETRKFNIYKAYDFKDHKSMQNNTKGNLFNFTINSTNYNFGNKVPTGSQYNFEFDLMLKVRKFDTNR